MHTHRVEILDRADHHDIVGTVPHDFEFELLPAQDRFLDQHLTDGTGLQPDATEPLQFGGIVGEAGAHTTHGVARTQYHGQPELFAGRPDVLQRVADVAAGALGATARELRQVLDHLFELLSVLTALDRIDGGTDQLNAVAFQHPVVMQGDRGIQRGLAPQGGQQGVRAFLRDDALDERRSDRLQIGGVGELRVGHDAGRVGVDQDHPKALGAQDPTGLRTGVVELGRLPDHDRA